MTVSLSCLQSGHPNTTLVSPFNRPEFVACVTLTTACTNQTNRLFENFVSKKTVNTTATLPTITSPAPPTSTETSLLCNSTAILSGSNATYYSGIKVDCVPFLAAFKEFIGIYIVANGIISVGCCTTESCNVGNGGIFGNGTAFVGDNSNSTMTVFKVGDGDISTGSGNGTPKGGNSTNSVDKIYLNVLTLLLLGALCLN